MPVLNSQNSFSYLQCTLMLVLISASLWLECASAACPRVPWCWRHISVDARMWLCITWGKYSINLFSRLLSYLSHDPRSLGTRLNSWSVFSLPSDGCSIGQGSQGSPLQHPPPPPPTPLSLNQKTKRGVLDVVQNHCGESRFLRKFTKHA